MRTLVKVLPLVLAAAVAAGTLLGISVGAPRSSDIARCVRDHGVTTSSVQRALWTCVHYAPISRKR